MIPVLTRRGWTAVIGSLIIGAGGRIIGVVELYVLAAGGVAAVLAAAVSVRVRRPRISASRRINPARVYAGGECRVELSVTNLARHPSPVVTATDPLAGPRRKGVKGLTPRGQARFGIAPVGPNQTLMAVYRLPAARRGVFAVGPLRFRRTDALGLATTVTPATPATELTVYPQVHDIVPLPQTHGHDPHAMTERASALGSSGEELYGLRAYEVGDDLRRVHWPSTARLDDLMIRQHEVPWQGRATILLDDRGKAHTEASLETAVSAAASILAACWRRRWLIRLVTTDGVDSGFAETDAHVDAVMERLAVLEPSPHDRLAQVVAGLRPSGDAGALAVITTANAFGDNTTAAVGGLDSLGRLHRGFGSTVMVVIDRSAMGLPPAATPVPPPTGATTVRVTAEHPFPVAWNAVLARSTGPTIRRLATR